VDAVFATGTAHRAGPDGELRHGRNLAGAVAAAGVPHVVYVSGDGAGPDIPLPLFRVKHQVEALIRSLPAAHTILAPVYLMENLFNPWNLAALQAGVFPSPVDVDVRLQQVAIADLVGLATLAIERPEAFADQRIRVASDELAAREAADALARVTGRQFTAVKPPRMSLRRGCARYSPGSSGPATTSTFPSCVVVTRTSDGTPTRHGCAPSDLGWRRSAPSSTPP
jgi:uncharacterized protein YbjT (DUF2867 family)